MITEVMKHLGYQETNQIQYAGIFFINSNERGKTNERGKINVM